MLSDHIIPDNYLNNVCKYRQGSSCCKYIVYLAEHKNFFCGKMIEEIKLKIDSAVNMQAKGDNCSGLPDETKQKS